MSSFVFYLKRTSYTKLRSMFKSFVWAAKTCVFCFKNHGFSLLLIVCQPPFLSVWDIWRPSGFLYTERKLKLQNPISMATSSRSIFWKRKSSNDAFSERWQQLHLGKWSAVDRLCCHGKHCWVALCYIPAQILSKDVML